MLANPSALSASAARATFHGSTSQSFAITSRHGTYVFNSMGRDEQKEEREVLDSIFPDEITDVSETEYRVSIAIETPEQDEESTPPTLILRVQLPEAYPDVAPDLDIWGPPNAAKYEYLDVQEDKARLMEALQPSIEENMGMAMVFTLVSTLKDAAELLISERKQAQQALLEVEAAKAEEEENRKFQGEAVTRESFLRWQAKFQQEMDDEERRKQEEREADDKKKRVAKEERKLTGRELWEKGLAGRADEDEEGDVPATEVAKLSIDE